MRVLRAARAASRMCRCALSLRPLPPPRSGPSPCMVRVTRVLVRYAPQHVHQPSRFFFPPKLDLRPLLSPKLARLLAFASVTSRAILKTALGSAGRLIGASSSPSSDEGGTYAGLVGSCGGNRTRVVRAERARVRWARVRAMRRVAITLRVAMTLRGRGRLLGARHRGARATACCPAVPSVTRSVRRATCSVPAVWRSSVITV